MTLGTLYKREMAAYFVSPMAYIILLIYSLISGITFVFWLVYVLRFETKEFTLLQASFNGFFFWFTLIVQVPLVTMRSFSEEFKMGTMEMLLTAPVREWEVVLAKYAAALSFFVILWLPTVLNLVWLHIFNPTPLPVIWGMTLLPYAMLILLGAFYISIGLFTSSLTKNQIVAGIMSFAAIFFMFCSGFVGYLVQSGDARDLVSYFSAIDQMETFARGTFDTRPVVLYLTGTVLFLFLTHRSLEARRLKA